MKHNDRINTSLADGLRAVAAQLPKLADSIAYADATNGVNPIQGPVAYMVGGHVLCGDCLKETNETRFSPVYRENIGQYSQDCHRCGDVLVQGKDGWPRLFENPDANSNVHGTCADCGDYAPLVVPVGKSPLSTYLNCVPCTNGVTK